MKIKHFLKNLNYLNDVKPVAFVGHIWLFRKMLEKRHKILTDVKLAVTYRLFKVKILASSADVTSNTPKKGKKIYKRRSF